LINEIQTKTEAAIAELRNIEARQTQKRDEQTQATDAFNKVQSDFYAKSAEISRLEQALQHAEERKTSLESDLERSRKSLDEMNRLLESDTAAIQSLGEQIETLEPAAAAHNEAAETANQALQAAEQRAQNWQQEWDDFNQERAEVVRREHAEQVRLEHLHESISGAQARIDGLQTEQQGLSTLEVESAITALRAQLLEAEKRQDGLLVQRDQVKSDLQSARSDTYRHGDELHELRTELATLRGTEASLSALQDAALRDDSEELKSWLREIGLDDGAVLAEQIEIERGWETAVEMALKVPLGAICESGSNARALHADRTRRPPSVATFIDDARSNPVPPAHAGAQHSLASKVRSKWPVTHLLAGVYAADTLDQAEQMAATLAEHESVITRDGYWLGPSWLQINGGAEAEAGILERGRQLEEVRTEMKRIVELIGSAQAEFEAAQAEVEKNEEREAALDLGLQDAMRETTELKTSVARRESELERRHERTAVINREIDTLQAQFSGGESAAAETMSGLQQLRSELARLETKSAALVAARAETQEQLDAARAEWRDAREARHETALKLESLRSNKESLSHALERNRQQRQELLGRCTDLESAMVSAMAPQDNLKDQLERALAARITAENTLAAARKTLEDFEHEIRLNDEARVEAERAVEAEREVLDQARLEARAVEVRQQEIEKQLEQTAYSRADLLAELDDDATEAGWHERLEKIRARIERLGPINLAAIDEFTQLSERKEYLDSQHSDLAQALDTLEGAIRKIDRETRTRFKETFDKVNSGLQKTFPILFGGGHAYLELTGDDLLETGVTVMARPPGKRNSTIHLLSGGEKALTALAFVFSLFELNPAPFCLLDEVDAPLDDANVVRLSKMLQSMSETVQFICVTHNKITMEVSEHLVGVTMQEAGVSRLVSVNMAEAVEMAAAS